MTYDEDEEEKRRQSYEMIQAAIAIQKVAQSKQEENLEKIIKKQKESQTKYNIEVFREQQKDILDTQSQNIRMYLQDNLVTFLAEGLQDICLKQPEDPVDALAEYLFKRSLEVRYPDPTQYWTSIHSARIHILSLFASKTANSLYSTQIPWCK